MKKIIITLATLVTLSIANLSFVSAAISATISVVPINPSPKSTVTLTFESYTLNMSTSMITWKINNQVVLEGQGQKKLSIKTGDVGESAIVTATALAADGSTITQSINITPSSIVLLYEAPKSYVPLLYEGRSLPSSGALTRISALPSLSDAGVPVSPSNLSYTWYMDDTIMRDGSGLGKQSITVRLDSLKTKSEIKVVARSPLGNTGEKKITIYPHQVMPILYKYDSILGTNFTNAIERRFEAVSDFTLSLEPFYVSDEDNKPATYIWYLDGLPATPLGGRILGLAPKANSYGTKLLTISVLGADRRIQKTELKTELIFDTRK